MSPKTDKTVDLSVKMNDVSANIENEEIEIIRRGSKQFVTNIYKGEGFCTLPKTQLKKVMKELRKKITL